MCLDWDIPLAWAHSISNWLYDVSWVGMIDLRVRKIENKASSRPEILSRTFHFDLCCFYYSIRSCLSSSSFAGALFALVTMFLAPLWHYILWPTNYVDTRVCCFGLLTRAWERLKMRPPVALKTRPPLAPSIISIFFVPLSFFISWVAKTRLNHLAPADRPGPLPTYWWWWTRSAGG